MANVARRHVGLFASHEDALMPHLAELSVAETAAAMADWANKARDNDPDTGVHRCVTAGRSTILDYGTTTRTTPAPLWNALVLRDVRCRFPHCDRPSYFCEGHHVIEFPRGTTKLANLVLGGA